MSFVQNPLLDCYLLQLKLDASPQFGCLARDVVELLPVLLFVSDNFQGLVLHLLDVQVPVLFLLQYPQFVLEGLDFVLLGLEHVVVVDSVQLPSGNEYFVLEVVQLHLLPLHLESPLPHMLLLLVYLVKPNAVVLLLCLLLHQNLVQLLGQLVYLRLQLYVLLDQPLLLVLLRQQLLQLVLRLLILPFLLIRLLLHFPTLEALLRHHELVGRRLEVVEPRFTLEVGLHPTVHHLDLQLFLFVHMFYLLRLHMNYYGERSERERSRSRQKQEGGQEREYRALEGRWKLQETKTLTFEGGEVSKEQVESIFMDLSITLGTSVPDEVEIQGNKAFIRYPSVEAAMSIFEKAKGQIQIKGETLKLQYWPIRKLDLSLAYDWYCEGCGYKNFGRRGRCYRCDTEKTDSSRLSYSNQPAVRPVRGDETPQNCSLMLRGPVITQIDENSLLEAFEQITSVKDIRQIRNRICGGFKDYAFIEFFTPQDTKLAFHAASHPDFKLKNQRVTAMYSRNRADDDFTKPLPYQSRGRERRGRDKPKEEDNYYHRQRQRQIEQQKARPTITMEQLKEKHEQELRKKQPAMKEMTAEQSKRRQAEQLAKQWEKEMKVVATMYICPICRRKFNSHQQMKLHETTSELHKFHMNKLNSAALAL